MHIDRFKHTEACKTADAKEMAGIKKVTGQIDAVLKQHFSDADYTATVFRPEDPNQAYGRMGLDKLGPFIGNGSDVRVYPKEVKGWGKDLGGDSSVAVLDRHRYCVDPLGATKDFLKQLENHVNARQQHWGRK